MRRSRRRPPARSSAASRSRRPTCRCAPSPPIDADAITFTANAIDDATSVQVWQRDADGTLRALTDEPGVHGVAVGGGTVVVRTTTLAEPGAQWETLDGIELVSHAAVPRCAPTSTFSFAGESRIATAVLLPHDHDGSPLPVLLDPYGGPHGPRVVQAHNAHLASQWFADQGFAVVVADGRGTPGAGRRGSAPCTSTSPRRCSTTRSPRCSTPPSSTRST